MAKKLRVLIVEDHPEDAELMALRLEQEGYKLNWQRVETEPAYLEALKTRPNLILADWSLPQFSGLRALKLMQERELDIPFILVTGSIGEELAVAALQQGAYDYVLKDRTARLGQAVGHALEQKKLRQKRRMAEAALRESEELYRQLFEAESDAIVLIDNETGRILEANNAAAAMYGYSRDELLSKKNTDLSAEPDKTREVTQTTPLDAERVVTIPLRFHRKSDGTVFPVEITGRFFTRQGRDVHLAAIRDIAERMQAEETLRKSEEQYRMLADNATDVVWTMDPRTGKFTYFSPSVQNLRGYSPAEAMALPLEKTLTRDSLRRSVTVYRQALEWEKTPGRDPNRTSLLDLQEFHKDGSIISTEARIKFLRDAQGSLVGLLGITRDITERKRAEERIHHLNQVLRAIRDVNRLIVRAEEPQKLIGEVCQVLVETRGYQSAKIILTDAAGKPEAYAEAGIGVLFQTLAEYLDKGYLPPCCEEARALDSVYLLSDRQRVCAPCPISAMCRATDAMSVRLRHRDLIFGYLAVAMDHALGVDAEEQGLFADMGGDLAFALYNLEMRKAKELAEEEQKKLSDQLIQAQKMEAVGRLAGGVAHDFNNMLSVILGYSETILADLNPADPIYKDLSEVKAAAERSANLTRQLLAFSRRQTIAPKVIDLKEQMKGMEFLLRRIIGEDIDLEFVFPEYVWSVSMDPSQLDQIVANLAVNARDAMPDGGKMTIEMGNITLDEAYCQDHLGFSPGEYVLLALSDNGCGMDKETLAHVFEPFFTTKGEGKGTGLGLSTVYGIVKQNNGFVNFYSELGQGTAAKIYLPRHVGEEKAQSAPTLKTGTAGGHETILLVEDEGQVRRLAKTILERSGYQVLEAGEPFEAIALCEKHPGDIHLVLTDVVMPNMNGKDLEERIRVLKPNIKSLFMSGYTANAIAHRGVLEKGIHFIQKPFSLTTLAKKVREVLDQE